ncbi:MAG: heme ABC exporter ATP-binding protein CcmA [Anaerolineales bacterium]|nr:heme ABC exporter ATP-binding protein CcmA [Anaerolineales bacterium]
MILIRQLLKNYGLQPVLRQVDLDVARGEFLTLFGPNGAGKTTLLRIIAALCRPTSGEVRVGGWELPKSANRVRPHLGFISHHPLLYAELTARENLQFFGRMYELKDIDTRIHEVLEAVGLNSRSGDPVGQYSRGMQQRLSIARAILHQPDILLLDEPYTGLDPSAATMLDEILQSVATAGRTVVLTTHDITRGLANCDRVALLSRGRIVYQADSKSLAPEDFFQVYNRLATDRRTVE